MWKVMIADDENYMLEAMENLIDWSKMDCQLVFKAKNGLVLLEQIKKNMHLNSVVWQTRRRQPSVVTWHLLL